MFGVLQDGTTLSTHQLMADALEKNRSSLKKSCPTLVSVHMERTHEAHHVKVEGLELLSDV